MNIKRAKAEIKDTIEAYLLKNEYGEYEIPSIRQRPVLMLGAPGIGKTQIMEQIAQECGIGLVAYTITHHTRQSAIGLPFISKKEFGEKMYSVTEYTMSEIVGSIYEKIEQTGLREGILFIDEINCVSETLAPAMLQFLQCKTFGSHAIPEGWVIVAAGNPPEYNKSVRDFDVVTLDRVKKIDVEPDFGVWKEYALKKQLHSAIISYLVSRTGNFYKMETTVDGRKFATPRGWEDLSAMLYVYEKLGKEMNREVVVQYIQHEMVAKDFSNYLELYKKYQMDYQLDEVLAGRIDPILLKKAAHASFDERLGVVSLLLARCRAQFSSVFEKELIIQMIFAGLKEIKESLLGVWSAQPEECIQEMINGIYVELESKKKAELLDRKAEHAYRAVVQKLECDLMDLKKEGITNGADAFDFMRDRFDMMQDELEEQQDHAGELLEHAFDFMEAAYGSGQEMVIFITELNSDFYSIKFLENYECERYYYYNETLLFEESSKRIEARLQAYEGL